jgi:hypothetical protein
LAVALSFCRLLGLGCPKQAFAKIATPRYIRVRLVGGHGQSGYQFPGFSADENESDSNTPGGQLGHPGKTLDFFENPDHVIDIPIDHGRHWRSR